MDNNNGKNNNKETEKRFNPGGKSIQDFIKLLSEEEGLDYLQILKKYKESPEFVEFSEIVQECDEIEDEDIKERKLKAFEYKLKYKFTDYKIPVCPNEEHKEYINNLEKLIEVVVKKDLDNSLKLIYNFLIRVIPSVNKDKRKPSDIAVSSLTRDSFENWVKDRIAEFKENPIEIIKYKVHKEMLNFDQSFWQEQKELKKKMLSDKDMLKKEAEALVTNVQDYYEAFRLVCGMLIGLFDLLEGNYDENIENSYYGDKFNTDLGFYSSRKTQANNRLISDSRPTLKDYIEHFGCTGFKDLFQWLMNSVKPIRLTGAHHKALIDQDKISEGKFKIKYRDGIKETHIDYIHACSTSLSGFITLTFWVAYHYLLIKMD